MCRDNPAGNNITFRTLEVRLTDDSESSVASA
jgi:hypothetical protein